MVLVNCRCKTHRLWVTWMTIDNKTVHTQRSNLATPGYPIVKHNIDSQVIRLTMYA